MIPFVHVARVGRLVEVLARRFELLDTKGAVRTREAREFLPLLWVGERVSNACGGIRVHKTGNEITRMEAQDGHEWWKHKTGNEITRNECWKHKTGNEITHTCGGGVLEFTVVHLENIDRPINRYF